MRVLTCEQKVCWVSALSDSIIHCISELGGMPDTKAPNDQEVLFESVGLFFNIFFFSFLQLQQGQQHHRRWNYQMECILLRRKGVYR